jgi:phage terminase large subunit GpA-like protein
MFAFRTDTLGEPFDEQSTSIHPGIFALKASRAALPSGVVPRWASMLIATVDTQARHVKVVVRAWGRSANDACAESALVWAGAAETDDGRFAPLDELLRRIWPVDGSGQAAMRIGLLLIDSGGTKLGDAEISRTEQVYRWVAARQHGGIVWAIKGQGDWSPARDAKGQHYYPAETSKHQIVKPWMIDVGFFSDALAWDIEQGREKPEEEIWHLCKDVPAGYIQELSNNIKVLERGTRGVESKWRPISSGACIDYFDCEVYQMAAVRMVEARYPLPPREVIEEARKAEGEAARQVQAPKEERPWDPDEEEFRRLREGRPDPNDAWTPTAYKL